MGKRLTQEEVIVRFRAVHGDKYEYLDYYEKQDKPIRIRCKKHDHIFKQTPVNHWRGERCPLCAREYVNDSKRMTLEEFIRRAREVHGDLNDYSKVVYANIDTKVCIICPIHKEFWQTPRNHLKGKGCIKCAGVERKTMEQFVIDARKVHGDKYNYTSGYVNWRTKVPIECPIDGHGIFWQAPNSHLRGQGCPKCKANNQSLRQMGSLDDFIAKARLIHGDRYEYEQSDYKGSGAKLLVTCKIHGDFPITPDDHYQGKGCPKCNLSHGESKISLWLDSHNIEYVIQYPIELTPLLFQRNHIRVDFFIPSLNTIIEFHGEQHYAMNPFFHKDEDAFRMQVDRDIRLREYCKLNKIKLIEIPYKDFDNIDKILRKRIGRLMN